MDETLEEMQERIKDEVAAKGGDCPRCGHLILVHVSRGQTQRLDHGPSCARCPWCNDSKPTAADVTWTRDSDGNYEARFMGGLKIGSVYRGGTRGYEWSWYATNGKHSDSRSLGNAKDALLLANGIEPPPVNWEAARKRADARAERAHAEYLRRERWNDVHALRRAAKTIEQERPNTAVFLRARASEIESLLAESKEH